MNALKTLLLAIGILYLVALLAIYLFQERFIFLPEALEKSESYQFETEFDEQFYEMSDGAVINALYFHAKNPRGVIFYQHGNAGNLTRWGSIAESLTVYGYDVLIYDYRGYGKSSGDRSETKLFDDAGKLYDVLKEQWSEDQIVLFGRSLGSGIACHVASCNTPKTLILETPFFDLKDVAKNYFPLFPTTFLIRYKFENHKKIADVNFKVHILHGTEDNIVPYDSGVKLYETIAGEASFYEFSGANHNNLATYPKFDQVMMNILKN